VITAKLSNISKIGVDRIGNQAELFQDPEILRLENLDTDTCPPAAALAATRLAMEDDNCNSYLPFPGQGTLRHAVVERVFRNSGIQYDWNAQCVISAGGLSGILNVLLSILEPGDEVVLTDPTYVGLINRVRLAGGVPVFARLVPENIGWRLDIPSLQQAVSSKTRAFLIMTPSMPTGFVARHNEWIEIAKLVCESDAWLIYDAAMERILFDGLQPIHPASLPGMLDRCVTVGSASKEYRMIGWRVGWIVGPRDIMPSIYATSLANVVCPVGIAMPGVTAALTTKDDGLREAIRTWQARRDLLMQELSGLPIMLSHGGWSMLIDVQKLGLEASKAAELLLTRGKIASTPMSEWGPSGDHYVRFVYSNEPLSRLRGIRARIQRAWNI